MTSMPANARPAGPTSLFSAPGSSRSPTQATSTPVANVRTGLSSDRDALVELINEAYLVERDFVRGPRISTARVSQLLDEGQFLVLDGDEGALDAAVYVSSSDERGRFGLLSVHPDRQRQGLGRRMVAVAEMICASRGCTTVDIQIVNLRDELSGFYGAFGYRAIGTAAFPASETQRSDVHFICMRKELEPAESLDLHASTDLKE